MELHNEMSASEIKERIEEQRKEHAAEQTHAHPEHPAHPVHAVAPAAPEAPPAPAQPEPLVAPEVVAKSEEVRPHAYPPGHEIQHPAPPDPKDGPPWM